MPANEKKLRAVLKANAFFSLFSGAGIALFHSGLAGFMGIANGQVLIGVGIGLMLFSITVFYAAMQKTISPKQVKSIIIQDWAWVLGSALVIALQAWELTIAAYWAIGIVALIVADFAIFQSFFLRKLR